MFRFKQGVLFKSTMFFIMNIILFIYTSLNHNGRSYMNLNNTFEFDIKWLDCASCVPYNYQ